jgi:hypothetical protein
MEESDVKTQPSIQLRSSPVASARAITRYPHWLVAVALAPLALPAHSATPETIATGLNSPRGLAFAPNGALYVAEGGTGGPGPCVPSPVAPAPRCYGDTGSIALIKPEGGFERIVSDLPSLALPTGASEGGPVDVSFVGTSMYVTMSWGGNPAGRAALGDKGLMFGTMLHVTPSGQYRVVTDVSAHEASYNPAGGPVDSNPYGSIAQPGRRIVADAGANALIEVLANGRTRTLVVPPPLPPVAPIPAPREAVTTSVVEGPDGALYVSQLTSFPFYTGTSSVLRIASDGSSIETFATGFTAVVDLAFDAGGALYVLEIASGQSGPFPPPNPGLGNGRLLRKCPGAAPSVLLDGLLFASGVAIGPDGAAYVTNRGTSAGIGEVLRLQLDPCQ